MAVAFLFGMVIGLMALGVPVAISLGLSSVIFLLSFSDASLASIAQTLFSAFDGHYTLLAIPFFILASSFMSTGGVARRIIRFAIAVVGHFKGGLAIASVFACMMFAALSGSSPATVIAIAFSQNTWRPARAASITMSRWALCGVTTATASQGHPRSSAA